MPTDIRSQLNAFIESRKFWWAILAVVVLDIGLLNAVGIKLLKEADGIIFKNTPEISSVWIKTLLDEDQGVAFAYKLIFAFGSVIFVTGSWWLIKCRFQRQWNQVAFCCWAGVHTLGLLLMFSALSGVVDTIDQFPIVAFSGSTALEPHSLSILLGSDDKQFALLIVNVAAKDGDLKRTLLYIPRAEIKWINIIGVRQLQPIVKLVCCK
jgi:hypothetical protein